jgi:hypothetical protein
MRGWFSLCVLVLLAGAAPAGEVRVPAAIEDDEQALWHTARGAVSAEPVWRYLDRFPKGAYTDHARLRLAKLGAQPGRRFDGRWSGEMRCASGWEWLRLPLEAVIDDGAVRTDASGARFD